MFVILVEIITSYKVTTFLFVVFVLEIHHENFFVGVFPFNVSYYALIVFRMMVAIRALETWAMAAYII